MIVWGAFIKLAVADNIRVFVSTAFNHHELYPDAGLWLAAYAGLFMVYADFLAYTEIARGLGRLFGVKLTANFRQPFFSTTITGFWQRWHITLTRWIFDYVAAPLHRTFRHPAAKPIITITVMALFGIWHGASWNFLIFGTWFGLCIAIWRPLEFALKRTNWSQRTMNLIRRVLTILMLSAAYPTFAITDISHLNSFMARLMGWQDSPIAADWSLLTPGVGAICAWLAASVLILTDVHDHGSELTWWEKLSRSSSSPLRWCAGTGLLILTALLAASSQDAFVYFQF